MKSFLHHRSARIVAALAVLSRAWPDWPAVA